MRDAGPRSLLLALAFAVSPARAQAPGADAPSGAAKAQAVVYARTYFLQLFLEKDIARSVGAILAVPLYSRQTGPIPTPGLPCPEGQVRDPLTHECVKGKVAPSKTAGRSRLESSPFERLLGDFDVVAAVDESLREEAGQARSLVIRFPDSTEMAEQLALHARPEKAGDFAFFSGVTEGGNSRLLALKVSYGLGPRKSSEQLGFVKHYRPFIHVLGKLVTIADGRVVWKDTLCVFGPKSYTASQADAGKIDGPELVTTFRALAADVATLVVRSLNADPIPDRQSLPRNLPETW